MDSIKPVLTASRSARLMVNTIVSGCEVKERGENRLGFVITTALFIKNLRSLWGKCGEIEILLESEITNGEVLCFTVRIMRFLMMVITPKRVRAVLMSISR
jgi:hypothetical protein